ncbi:hypothetical protein KS4_24170 [Poriferisphaera corsica]|uniref:PEP-CTERM protein-sorting domain-containing protein n=1 Tax=Poriferisphaera corsica TaxID=2528020 RepID=A0A517YVV0_9BACT|nr:hypothetical protein [Poriferisphaera corsica]QDU34349.1 hypothetical protein KS4_24170 [Poriferisphaera corsica]
MSMRLSLVLMMVLCLVSFDRIQGAILTWETGEQFGEDIETGESIRVTTKTVVDTALRRVRYTVSSSQSHAKVVLNHVLKMWGVIDKPFAAPVWTGGSYDYSNGTMYSPYASEVAWPGPDWGNEVEYDFLTNAAPNNDGVFVFGYDYQTSYGIDGASLPMAGEDGNLAIVFRDKDGDLPGDGMDEEQFFEVYVPNFVVIPEPSGMVMVTAMGMMLWRRSWR